jgi:hypothetical protein
MQGVLQFFYKYNTFDIWWFNLEYPQPYYNHDNHDDNHDNDDDNHHGRKFIFILYDVYIS